MLLLSTPSVALSVVTEDLFPDGQVVYFGDVFSMTSPQPIDSADSWFSTC